MQFTGKSGIAVFVLLVLGAVGLGFGSGWLVGRQFPAHHFEHMQEGSHYLFDTSTGHVCDFWPTQASQQNTAQSSSYSVLFGANTAIPPCN
jgi:hypothetical protein